MAYVGNAPARSFISFERQVFTIVNSQTAYALSHSVANENDIRLVVNNVVQEPGSGKAYTATGTALTLSAALTNGTDEMYCVFLGRATATSAPGAGSIGTAQLASDSVTLAKMASGTDGNIISYDASGNPVAVATGNDGQVLTSAGAGAPPVFETPASAANTPAFEAYLNNDATPSNDTNTLVTFDTEFFDTASAYNTSTGKFTPQTAGKYFVYGSISGQSQVNNGNLYKTVTMIFKNGSIYKAQDIILENNSDNVSSRMSVPISAVVGLNGSSDYVQLYANIQTRTGGDITIDTGTERTFFGAYKIIT